MEFPSKGIDWHWATATVIAILLLLLVGYILLDSAQAASIADRDIVVGFYFEDEVDSYGEPSYVLHVESMWRGRYYTSPVARFNESDLMLLAETVNEKVMEIQESP